MNFFCGSKGGGRNEAFSFRYAESLQLFASQLFGTCHVQKRSGVKF